MFKKLRLVCNLTNSLDKVTRSFIREIIFNPPKPNLLFLRLASLFPEHNHQPKDGQTVSGHPVFSLSLTTTEPAASLLTQNFPHNVVSFKHQIFMYPSEFWPTDRATRQPASAATGNNNQRTLACSSAAVATVQTTMILPLAAASLLLLCYALYTAIRTGVNKMQLLFHGRIKITPPTRLSYTERINYGHDMNTETAILSFAG